MPLIIGLMSGTSVDGVDAAACGISMNRGRVAVKLIAGARVAYPSKLRERLLSLSSENVSAGEICGLNVEVAEIFAKAALKILKSPVLKGKKPEALGSHGQTVFHQPGRHASLQIGDGSVIAAGCGIKTWFDFRAADLAAGGQGAPLAPIIHLPLFGARKTETTVVNIGGIANVTHIPAGSSGLVELLAYDTGPGCMLLDLAARRMGAGNFDRGGRIASRGKVDTAMLKRLLDHRYFKARPPKSTGREIFGEAFFEWAGLSGKRNWYADMIATLTELTARTISDEVEKMQKRGRNAGRLVVCGGGAMNRYLLKRLKALAGREVVVSDKLGVPCRRVEPALMALLAFYAERGIPLDLTSLTGSKRPVLLGKLAPAPVVMV